jgi:hypothetical protein
MIPFAAWAMGANMLCRVEETRHQVGGDLMPLIMG